MMGFRFISSKGNEEAKNSIAFKRGLVIKKNEKVDFGCFI